MLVDKLADKRSLAVTAASRDAVAAFDAALDALLEYRLVLSERIAEALKHDPDFVLGHCLRGYALMLAFSNATRADAEASLRAAEALRAAANARERRHIAALRAWVDGDQSAACRIWDDILVEYPTDLLALRLYHFHTFWQGRQYCIRDACARVLPDWSEEMPGYGSVLGMYAFGLDQCGDYVRAEAMGRRAVAINPEDLWSVHAVAHVFESQGRLDEGVAWLDYTPEQLVGRAPIKGHVWWHRSLFLIELGEFDAVLDAYDHLIRPDRSCVFTDLQNAAALLWRLEFHGVDVGDRWRTLAEDCCVRIGDHCLPFTDTHVMMALVRREDNSAERMLDSVHSAAAQAKRCTASVWENAAIPVCKALLAFSRGDYGKAVDTLLSLRYSLQQLGGSHPQRDIFEQFLIEAAIRAGRLRLARALLAQRVTLRPNSVVSWRKYHSVSERLHNANRVGFRQTACR